MAIVECPNCGSQVSDTSSNCINCGAQVVNSYQSRFVQTVKKPNWAVIGLCSIISMVILYGMRHGCTPSAMFEPAYGCAKQEVIDGLKSQYDFVTLDNPIKISSFVLTEIFEIDSKDSPRANICEANLTIERGTGSSKKITKEWIVYLAGLDYDNNDNLVTLIIGSLPPETPNLEKIKDMVREKGKKGGY
jgi:hypothetical protein